MPSLYFLEGEKEADPRETGVMAFILQVLNWPYENTTLVSIGATWCRGKVELCWVRRPLVGNSKEDYIGSFDSYEDAKRAAEMAIGNAGLSLLQLVDGGK